jgi:rubrerythrin
MSSDNDVAMASIRCGRPHWSTETIDWGAIRLDLADNAPDILFYLVAASSFLEATTERYTANLIVQFRGDDEIIDWLERHWLPEELQHGRVLRRYVEAVWPAFPWERVYDAFLGEFAAHCCSDELEPTRCREMASRCVVEMGTAGYYTTLSRLSPEPVLAAVARHIAEDEIRHYKHFLRYFRRYRQTERTRRLAVAKALYNRLWLITRQDSGIVMKHLHDARHPGEPFNRRVYKRLRRSSRRLISPHFPHRMCVEMLLTPLGLPRRARRIAVPVAAMLARHLVP